MDEFDLDLNDTEVEMYEFNKKVWELIEPHSSTQHDVLMASAVLLKTAIQLYTVVLKDEDISAMLSHEACESIPVLRKKLQRMLNRSLH